jgi:hypothetical protein
MPVGYRSRVLLQAAGSISPTQKGAPAKPTHLAQASK